jgi:D-threonate/D-erythronate kinase
MGSPLSDLRILADDLTGALDSAAAFAGEVPVYLDAPAPRDVASFPVAAVATGTRDAPIETLPTRLAASVSWLAGAGLAFKKIDSLLRGNTYAEIAYTARTGGFRRTVFAPAFPKQGRVTVDGRQAVIPPGKSLADREVVGAGSPADAFAVFGLTVAPATKVRASAPSVWIPDVRTDDDLARVAVLSMQADAQHWLWCGSAGLAHAIAVAHGLAPGTASVAHRDPGPGPVLLISASHHPVVRRQWDIVRATERGAVMVTHGQQATLRAAFRAMGQGFDVAMFDLSPTRVLAPGDAAALLGRQLDAVVRQSPRPGALVVVGGDTLLALCRTAGAHALVAHASERVGWGCARFVGGAWDGVACYSRSGAFGDPDDLSTMVQQVARRTAIAKEA